MAGAAKVIQGDPVKMTKFIDLIRGLSKNKFPKNSESKLISLERNSKE